jgi:two-component system, LuxR family, response regulator FixJ
MDQTNATSKSRHVLVVVEDDSAVRESLKFSLGIEGFEVHAYASPDEFLNDIKRPGFDCLIVDYHLPGTNGLDVLEKLGETGRPAKAILLTGNPSSNIRQRAAAAGITLIEKSSGAVELIQSIRRIVGEPFS